MKQDAIIPRLTDLHMRVYGVYCNIERQELEQSKHRYSDEYRGEPQSSQLYGALKTLERLKDLGWALTQRWSKKELAAWLEEKCTEWTDTLSWHREVAANPYKKGLSEIARYQAEGSIPIYVEWMPAIEWLASSDRTKLPQHKEMRKRYSIPIPTADERERATRFFVTVSAIYEEAHDRCGNLREHEDDLDATQYGEFRSYEIVRNYLIGLWRTIPVLDALQRRVQDLCDSYRSHILGCQEQIDTYEQEVAKWERGNWCNYYRGPNEQPTEIEKEQFRNHYRREHGPEKQRAEMNVMRNFVDRLETAYRVSCEG